jgi:CubicO group peptidase (beta-lactamase class C family)
MKHLICLALVALSLLVSTAKAADGDLSSKLEQYLSRLAKLGFSGTVLVAKDGKVLLEKGYGMADRERKIPMAADSVISIGSITKQFTAAAILKLEMAGKLRVDEPIGRFFPGAPPEKAAITIHQLLTHSAGLESDYGPTDYEAVSRDEIIRRVMAAPLRTPPGKQYFYSNAGYSLLAAIVEILSGQSYETYLRENLFVPAGMKATGYKVAWRDGQVAHGYVDGKDWGTILDKPWDKDGPYWNLRGNGGIHSTAGDMYRWHLALEGDKILSKAAKEKYFKPYVPEGPEGQSYYAYGWAIFETPRKTRLVAHNGGNGVFAADFRRYVDENVVIYAASNAEPSAIALTEVLPAIVFGGDYAMPPDVIGLEASALDRLAGSYALGSGSRIDLTRDGANLRAVATGADAFALLHSPLPEEVSAKLNARVGAMVEASAKGDFKPIAEAFGGMVPLADVAENEGQMWGNLRERLGAFKRVEVLGSARMRPMAATVARLEFERGSQYIRFGWEQGELVGIRLIDELPSVTLYPASPTEFVSFSLRDPSPVTVKATGSSIALRRGAVEVTASRPPAK